MYAGAPKDVITACVKRDGHGAALPDELHAAAHDIMSHASGAKDSADDPHSAWTHFAGFRRAHRMLVHTMQAIHQRNPAAIQGAALADFKKKAHTTVLDEAIKPRSPAAEAAAAAAVQDVMGPGHEHFGGSLPLRRYIKFLKRSRRRARGHVSNKRRSGLSAYERQRGYAHTAGRPIWVPTTGVYARRLTNAGARQHAEAAYAKRSADHAEMHRLYHLAQRDPAMWRQYDRHNKLTGGHMAGFARTPGTHAGAPLERGRPSDPAQIDMGTYAVSGPSLLPGSRNSSHELWFGSARPIPLPQGSRAALEEWSDPRLGITNTQTFQPSQILYNINEDALPDRPFDVGGIPHTRTY